MINGGIIYQNGKKITEARVSHKQKICLFRSNNSIYMKLNGYYVSIMCENIIDTNNLDKKIFVNNIPYLLAFLLSVLIFTF